jgi:hypothetical protein
MAEKQTPAEKQGIQNPFVSGDPNIDDDQYKDLDPTKVVGTYAEQPDPNDEKGAPLPNVPKGVKKAPADDDPDAGAIGEGKQNS